MAAAARSVLRRNADLRYPKGGWLGTEARALYASTWLFSLDIDLSAALTDYEFLHSPLGVGRSKSRPHRGGGSHPCPFADCSLSDSRALV